MLSSIIDYINERVISLGYIPTVYGLVDRIKVDGKELPAQYCQGEWKYLTDFTDGFIYHRVVGSVNVWEVDEEETVSCEQYQRREYPMRFVFCKLKSKFANDIYSNELIANELLSEILFENNKLLGGIIGSDIVNVESASANIDIYDVFTNEFTNVDTTPLDYYMIAIDYAIIVEGKKSCFDKICSQ